MEWFLYYIMDTISKNMDLKTFYDGHFKIILLLLLKLISLM